MAFAKAIDANDIVEGAAVVNEGERTRLYDNRDRTQHITDANSGPMGRLANRFIYHGGPGGSGNWEH